MAVIKQAQRVIEQVISAQHIHPQKLPENSPDFQSQAEVPNMFNEIAPPTTGNISQLLTGMAQHYRVNNPYRYTATDEYGESTYKSRPWGCSKGPEVGGNKCDNAGAIFSHYFLDYSINGELKKRPAARIYYSMHTHMHRVASMKRANGTGGPYQILYEEDGGFKSNLDGFNRSYTPGYWVQKGFKTAEQAVAFCQKFGWAYEVEVPRHRYIVRKSYADNFKYKPLKTEE